MRIYAYIIVSIGLIFSLSVYAKGKVIIKSDLKGASVFIDNLKKTMIGDDGYSTLFLDEGDYEILLQKDSDEKFYFEGKKNVFIGNDSEIEITIPYLKTKKNNINGKYACIDNIRAIKIKENKTALIEIRAGNDISNYQNVTGKLKGNELTFSINKNNLTFYVKKNTIFYKDSRKGVCEKEIPNFQKLMNLKSSSLIGKWSYVRDPRITIEFQQNKNVIHEKKYDSKRSKKSTSQWQFLSEHIIQLTNSYGVASNYKILFTDNNNISIGVRFPLSSLKRVN